MHIGLLIFIMKNMNFSIKLICMCNIVLFGMVSAIEAWTLYMIGKCSSAYLYPQPFLFYFETVSY